MTTNLDMTIMQELTNLALSTQYHRVVFLLRPFACAESVVASLVLVVALVIEAFV